MTHLVLENLDVRHGQLRAVKDVNISIGNSEILALVGANGAGKSTLLRAIAGAHKPTSGRVIVNGADLTSSQSFHRVKTGVSLVPEGRKLFQDMSVEENLTLGSIAGRNGNWTVAKVFEAFPNLLKRRHAKASTLSGGEQQATAIGRALMSNPEILLLDEISLGLSPAAVDLVYASLQIVKAGTTIVLVEQDLSRALSFATRIVCMLEGQFVLDRPTQNVTREEITTAYFGKRGATH
ncbi:MAG: hypothetical protein RL761_254 [Pseudomonadota bacterium]|jgi:branched-chain amino acid transport system ATP-binding protein